jgi:hypothetical protein
MRRGGCGRPPGLRGRLRAPPQPRQTPAPEARLRHAEGGHILGRAAGTRTRDLRSPSSLPQLAALVCSALQCRRRCAIGAASGLHYSAVCRSWLEFVFQPSSTSEVATACVPGVSEGRSPLDAHGRSYAVNYYSRAYRQSGGSSNPASSSSFSVLRRSSITTRPVIPGTAPGIRPWVIPRISISA